MLILAGVVLNLTLGENGLIKIAKQARNEYTQAEENEQDDLDKLYSSILVAGDSKVTLTMEELDEYIDRKVSKRISEITVNGIYDTIFEGTAGVGIHDLDKDISNYRYIIVYAETSMANETSLIIDKNSFNSPGFTIGVYALDTYNYFVGFRFINGSQIEVQQVNHVGWSEPYIYLIKGVR